MSTNKNDYQPIKAPIPLEEPIPADIAKFIDSISHGTGGDCYIVKACEKLYRKLSQQAVDSAFPSIETDTVNVLLANALKYCSPVKLVVLRDCLSERIGEIDIVTGIHPTKEAIEAVDRIISGREEVPEEIMQWITREFDAKLGEEVAATEWGGWLKGNNAMYHKMQARLESAKACWKGEMKENEELKASLTYITSERDVYRKALESVADNPNKTAGTMKFIDNLLAKYPSPANTDKQDI